LDGFDPNANGKVPSDGVMTKWTDKSASNNSVTQVIGASQPMYNSSLKCASFNGSSQFLAGSMTHSPLGNQNWTIAAVHNLDTTINRTFVSVLIGTIPVSSPFNRALALGTNGLMPSDPYVIAAWDGVESNVGTMVPNTTAAVMGVYTTLPSAQVFTPTLTGPLSTVGNAIDITSNQVAIGSSTFSNRWDGNIFEVLIYNREVSTEQRLALFNYLTKKWNLS